MAAKLRAGTRIINLTTIGVCLLFLGSIYCGFRPSAKFAKWFALTASTLYMIVTVFNTIRNRELRSQMWGLSHAIHGSENRVYLLVCSNISRCMFTIVIAQVLLAVAVNLAESQHNQLKWDLLRFIGQSLTQFYGKF